MKKNTLVHWFIIGTFVTLYLAVSVISTLHVIKFFEMSNPYWLSVSLAIAFELGAAASLASLIVLDRMNKVLVWILFITLTLFQSMGNVYYAFVTLHDYQGWVELFDLVDEDILYQKRILSMISGAVLPFVALGFIKSLVDYIKPQEEIQEETIEDPKIEENPVLSGGEEIEEVTEPLIEEKEEIIVNVPEKPDPVPSLSEEVAEMLVDPNIANLVIPIENKEPGQSY
jgi:hypothetical protein